MKLDVATLEKLLADAKAEEEAANVETPHSRLLANLADHKLHPAALGAALHRIFKAFEVLGVDLLAEGGPVRVYSAAMAAPAPSAPTTTTEPVQGEPAEATGEN